MMKLRKIFMVSLAVLLLLGTTATAFAASEEKVEQERGRVTFAVVCKRWDYGGGMTKTTPYASGWIQPETNSHNREIKGTIHQQVGSSFEPVKGEETLTMYRYNTIPYDPGYGAAGSMCKMMIRNVWDNTVQITVTGYWDAA